MLPFFWSVHEFSPFAAFHRQLPVAPLRAEPHPSHQTHFLLCFGDELCPDSRSLYFITLKRRKPFLTASKGVLCRGSNRKINVSGLGREKQRSQHAWARPKPQPPRASPSTPSALFSFPICKMGIVPSQDCPASPLVNTYTT